MPRSAPVGRLPYYPGLDGIRGIGVVVTMMFHSDTAWAPGGYLALPTFFVLSGFLISTLLLLEYQATGTVKLGSFWDRRFRRLMPAAFITIAAIAIFGYTIASTAQLARLRADALSALFYVSNYRFIQSGLSYEAMFGAPTPVQHFWSLSVEEQFYLIYPLLMVFILTLAKGNRKILAIVLALLGLASSCWMAYLYNPDEPLMRIYYATDTRAAEFFLGGILAVALAMYPVRERLANAILQVAGIISLALVFYIGATVTLHTEWIWQGGLMFFCALMGTIVAACTQPGPVSSILGWYPFRELGKVSYGVYLYHWPIFLWLTPERTGLDPLPLFALRAAVSIIPAWFSYHYLEKQVRSQKWLSGNKAWWAASSTTILLVAGVVFVTHNPPPPWFLRGQAAMQMPPLETGEKAAKRILVVGDSISWSIGAGLARYTDALRLNESSNDEAPPVVWNIATWGCGLARGGEVAFAADAKFKGDPGCATWAFWWPSKIKEYQPDVVLIHSSGWDLVDRKLVNWTEFHGPGSPLFNDWLVDEYIEAVDVLSAEGAEVVWLTAPCIDTSLLRSDQGLRGTVAHELESILELNQQVLPRVAASRSEEMRLVDLYSHVCPNNTALQEIGLGEPLRPDGAHFSVPGAEWLAQWLLPQMLPEK